MSKKLKQILKYVLSLAVAVVLMYFCFRGVNWKDFLAGLATCNWPLVILSMLAGATAFLFRSFRWHRLLQPLDPTIDRLTTFNAVNIGNVSNYVIQGAADFVKTGVVARRVKKEKDSPGYDKILGTALLERAWDILSLILLFLVLIFFLRGGKFWDFFQNSIVAPIEEKASVSTTVVLILVILAIVALCLVIYLLRNKVKIFRRLADWLKGLLQGMKTCLKMKQKWLFFLYTLAIWACYWLQMVLMIRAFPVTAAVGLTALDAIFLMLVGSLAAFVPTPGGIGAYHFLVSLALTAIYSLSKADGMVFAILAHESQALNMGILGLAAYLIEAFRKKKQS